MADSERSVVDAALGASWQVIRGVLESRA